MQSNMALAVEFFGSVAINGVPSVMEGSNRLLQTKGGYISGSGTANPPGSTQFGRIMSVFASGAGSDDSAFVIGYPTGSGYVIVGPLLNEQGVRENDPAKPNYLFNEQPATVVSRGRLLYSSWGSSVAGAVQPYVGCRVCFEKATGEINFLIQGGTVPAAYVLLQASVVNVYQFTGIVDIDFQIPQTN